jgi:uncharacterized membrane protein
MGQCGVDSMDKQRSPLTRRPPATGVSRFALVDMARGLAVLLMCAYHFCYDLNYFGIARLDFQHDAFWRGSRTLILTLFLGIVGVSLYLSAATGFRWRAIARRLLLLLLCSGAVSLGSYVLFPHRWIYFGVLHFIALASLLGLAFVRLGRFNALLGAALIAAGIEVGNPWFNRPWLQWVGLMTYKPPTEDYVPLLPWFGIVLLGLVVGDLLYGRKRAPDFARRDYPSPPARVLGFLGRHSLVIYMTHQPMFMGMLYLLHRF